MVIFAPVRDYLVNLYDMLMRSRFYVAWTQVCDSYVSNLGILSILMYEGLNCVNCSPTVT